MEELRMFYHMSNEHKKGFVNSIEYGDKILASFNIETQKIDLSVLNPFVNKKIKLITVTIETGIAKISIKKIHRVETSNNGEIIIHLEDFEEEHIDD